MKDEALGSTKPCKLLTVTDIHCAATTQSDCHQTKVFVLDDPMELKWVKVFNHAEKSEEQVPTMKMLLTDGSGPIEMEVWRDVALVLRKMLDELLRQYPDNIYIDITYFRINAVDTCKLLSPMRKIVTTPRTIIKHQRNNMAFAASSTSILPPEQALYVRDFSILKQKAPFRVSIAGVVTEVDEATLTHAGNLKKCFILQDQAGRYVTCAALGRHAQSPAISTSTEVIVARGCLDI